MRNSAWVWLSLSLLLVVGGGCSAAFGAFAMRELGTVGPTEPAAPYYRGLGPKASAGRRPPVGRPLADMLAPQLPLRSQRLTVGRVEPAPFAGSVLFTIPVFVIGSDPHSLRWLARRRDALRRQGAVGYVVEVPDRAAWERLRAVAQDLPLYPIAGDGLASELGLRHYPALLSRRGIEP